MAENYDIFYEGSSSPLEPPADYSDIFTGYRIPAAMIGTQTSTQTADQIREVSSRLSEGVKAIELVPISPEVFEMIPKQHMKEINRLTKLTGAETSIHAPIIEPSGLTQQGWSEISRESAERQLFDIVNRSHELNPQGNVPVTVHTSASPGTEYYKSKEGKEGEAMLIAINQETGQMVPVRREIKYYPELKKEKIYEPREELRIINDTEWTNSISSLAFYKKEADEILNSAKPALLPVLEKIKQGRMERGELSDEEKLALNKVNRAGLFLQNIDASFRALYNKAYKYPGGETPAEQERNREMLRGVANEWQKLREEVKKGSIKSDVEYTLRKSALIDNTLQTMQHLGSIEGGLEPPNVYVPIEDFSIKKSSETFGNVAFQSYKKFGDNSPLMTIENVPVGMAVSRASDLKRLIDKSREQFVSQAIKEGYSEGEAREAAEKVIGATWDTSHINLLRKGGFTKEDIVKETREIAPYVKHVHYNDNFGHTHTDLPPGMGEVPMKEIMQELEKAGFKGKRVFEGAMFVQHFKISPHPLVLEGSGSPLYAAYMPPFWNQVRQVYGAYQSGYGTFLPEQHFSIYGAGFSGMPTELGGQIPGKQTRLTGTPME